MAGLVPATHRRLGAPFALTAPGGAVTGCQAPLTRGRMRSLGGWVEIRPVVQPVMAALARSHG
jgi:hypothetical protein